MVGSTPYERRGRQDMVAPNPKYKPFPIAMGGVGKPPQSVKGCHAGPRHFTILPRCKNRGISEHSPGGFRDSRYFTAW